MNRRLLLTCAVVPLIGLTIQGAVTARARHEQIRRIQYSDRQRRRAMTFSAAKEATQAVADASRNAGTAVGEPLV